MLRLITPDLVLGSVCELQASWAAARGLHGLLLDLDNTIVSYASTAPAEATLAHLRSLEAAGLRLVIVSNAGPARTAAVAGTCGLPYLAMAGKPSPRAFRRALEIAGCTASSAAVVGDQLFRDILGARLTGCLAVLVRPLSRRDFAGTMLLRAPERWLESYLRRTGRWPTTDAGPSGSRCTAARAASPAGQGPGSVQ
jgi:hypothetical protein